MAEYSKPYKAKDNTGNLFSTGNKQTKSQPDESGSMVLSKDLVKELVERIKSGKEAKLSLAVWHNTSLAGKPYKTLVVRVYEEPTNIEVPF